MAIQGVLGPLDPDKLGKVLVHEHITTADWSLRQAFGAKYFDETVIRKRSADNIRRVMEHGYKTIVDGTPINLGRDIALLRAVAEDTGMNIIASTGFYHMDDPWMHYMDEEYMFDLMCRECEDGIAGTDSRPGIMKAAVEEKNISKTREKMLLLSARVAKRYDLPIFCHHPAHHKNGKEILDIFFGEGIKPNRICMGHTGDANDPQYAMSLMETGCYIGEDRLPMTMLVDLETRAANTVQMMKAGYAKQILLSHDHTVYSGMFESFRQYLTRQDLLLGTDLTYLPTVFVSKLRELGCEESEIELLTDKNPQVYLSGE